MRLGSESPYRLKFITQFVARAWVVESPTPLGFPLEYLCQWHIEDMGDTERSL